MLNGEGRISKNHSSHHSNSAFSIRHSNQILFMASAATVSPIASEDVAAGEGALHTLITRFSSKIKKSSTNPPSRSQA
jgi:hypothetical protein